MTSWWVQWGHLVCLGIAGGACLALVLALAERPPASVVRQIELHVLALDRRATALRWPVSGRHLAVGQAVCVASGAVAAFGVNPAVGAALLVMPALVGPLLDARVNVRLALLDQQLEPWLRSLAGSLASGASLGQAIEESAALVDAPLREEIEQAARDMSLGTSVAESLLRMGTRVGSATLSTAIAAIRIGTRSGDGLPRTLRESAASLREMARLEGVVRTRTAEARAQAAVVGVIPVPMVAFIHHLNPTLMSPLWTHPRGWVVVSLAVVLWVVSILAARKILHVDI